MDGWQQYTLVLFQTLRFPDLIENDDLFDDLVVQFQDILALDISRSVALQQFQLGPYRLQLVEYGLLLRIQRYPWQR